MNKLQSVFIFGMATCFMAIIVGCGGVSHSGGSSSTVGGPVTNAKGKVSLTIKWPSVPATPHGIKPRLVPEAAQSVGVVLKTADGNTVAQQVVARPTGQPTSTATFSNVPTLSITVTATAYPNPDGTGTALASGSIGVSVTSSGVTTAPITMGTTIDHLELAPVSPAVAVGSTTPLTATAKDASGSMVLVAPSSFRWSSASPAIATVDTNGTVTGIATGSTAIMVTDSESTKTAILTITVTQGGSIVTGTVTGTDGSLLSGARVETTDGNGNLVTATTGADGKYSLTAPPGQRVITFSKCGYTTTQDVTVANNTAITANAQLPVYSGPDPTSPPLINVDSPQVDQTTGQAIVTGTIQQGNSSGGVIIVNGSEAEFSIDDAGSFSYSAILVPGTNTIQVRASNCMGTTVSNAVTATYSPSGNAYFRVTLTWDGTGDVDLHIWDPNLEHSYFGNTTIITGSLDRDNTVSFGPENFTCTNLTPGRYEIGVDAYDKSEGRSATIKVSIFSGPNQGKVFYYGPYTFTATDGDANYPVIGNTAAWWRPADIVVGDDGSIVMDAPNSVQLPHLIHGRLNAAAERRLKLHQKGQNR
jgi:hypothetical protein